MCRNITNGLPILASEMLTRFLTCLLLLSSVPTAKADLPQPMRAGLGAAGIPEEAVGVMVVRLSDGATVLAHRERESMQPASTMKLVTSLATLEKLGPAYRARTQLRSRGELADGVLHGNLVLRGGGDVDFDWRAFEHALSMLRAQGIREIEGDLIVDLTYFRPARADIGAVPFDGTPEFRYNVIPDALLLNTYLLHLDINSRGGTVRMVIAPALAGVSVVSELTPVERACDDWEDGWKLPAVNLDLDGTVTIRIRGEFPRDCTASTEINVIDRMAFVDRLFRSLWTHMGGTFRGRTREGDTPPDSRLLTEHRSRPLAEVTHDINKHSDNPITRVAYLTLGAMSDAPTDLPTAQRAAREVRSWLANRGIDPRGLVLENGSGLSRIERIRADQLVAVLRAALSSPWAPEFLASLPIVGVDGAMRQRLAQSAAASHSRIKTGTLRDVSAIAGFVKDGGGELHVVVAMINHERATSEVARPILDSLIDWVANRREPQPAPAPLSAY